MTTTTADPADGFFQDIFGCSTEDFLKSVPPPTTSQAIETLALSSFYQQHLDYVLQRLPGESLFSYNDGVRDDVDAILGAATFVVPECDVPSGSGPTCDNEPLSALPLQQQRVHVAPKQRSLLYYYRGTKGKDTGFDFSTPKQEEEQMQQQQTDRSTTTTSKKRKAQILMEDTTTTSRRPGSYKAKKARSYHGWVKCQRECQRPRLERMEAYLISALLRIDNLNAKVTELLAANQQHR